MPLPVQPTTSPTPSDAPSEQSGFKSSEFFASAAVIAVNTVGILAVVFKMTPDAVDQINHALTAILSSAAVMAANGLIVWRYIESRRSVKTTSIVAETSLQHVKALIAASPDANSPGQDQAILASIQTMHRS